MEKFSNGNSKYKGETIDGLKSGYWEYYHVDGSLLHKGEYINGLKDDIWESYHMNGDRCKKIRYKLGVRDGISLFYCNDKVNIITRIYKLGEEIKISK